MNEDLEALLNFSGVTRLFPLPSLVMFPRIDQKLHIFEPRYREMTAEALAGDGLISLVLLKSGWMESTESGQLPLIEKTACLGRITESVKYADGRYDILIEGLARLKIEVELPLTKSFREARGSIVPDVVIPELEDVAQYRQQLREKVLWLFEKNVRGAKVVQKIFASEESLDAITDYLAYSFPFPLLLKQQLLGEARVVQRVLILLEAFSNLHEHRKYPPKFSAN